MNHSFAKVFFLAPFFLFGINSTSAAETITREQALKSVVQILIINQKTEKIHSTGSGILLDPMGKKVATALHVVNPVASNDSLFDIHVCLNENNIEKSSCYFAARVDSYNEEYDVAILVLDRAFESNTARKLPLYQFDQEEINRILPKIYFSSFANRANPSIGDGAWIAGYPQSGGNSITMSAGILSGMELGKLPYSKQNVAVQLKTDASANHGSSGGPIFDDKNNLLGITTHVNTDITPITFVTSWAVIKDLLGNGVSSRTGVLCPDYKNMDRLNGKCECKDELIWNEGQYACIHEENISTSESEPEEERDLLPMTGLNSEEQKEKNSEEEQETVSEEKTIQEEEKSDFSSSEKEMGRKKIQDGVLDAILECKSVRQYGKEAFRNCFRQSFLNFIKSRQAVLTKMKKMCSSEMKENSSLFSSATECVMEKMQ